MAYWWVNQNQTFAQELSGGYLWSPKRKRNGARNEYYDNMTRVQPGDLIFSFRDTRIAALSVAISTAYECPKPTEFGTIGANWDQAGWRLDADYVALPLGDQIRPKDHIDLIAHLLPEKYAPLSASGDGLQAVYLAHVPDQMAAILLDMIPGGRQIAASLTAVDPEDLRDEAETRLVDLIEQAPGLDQSEKASLIKARRGQGKFRADVLTIERSCRITGVTNPVLLRASHIKPWSHCQTHAERLDQHNGLMLTPNADHLFDAGFITFDDAGEVVVSPALQAQEATRLGLDSTEPARPFIPAQRVYLAYHREHIFRR